MLKVVVIGSSEMASSLLLGVKEAGHEVVGFLRYERISISQPFLFLKDLFAPSDFFMLAKSQNIPEIKVKSVNSEKFRKIIRKLNADIVLVGTWGEKFSQKSIITPKIATINCHPSLLPTYRGPNPYMAVLMNGEEKTGVTFHLMDEKYDSGAILLQVEVPISFSDTGYTLKLKCVKVARDSLKTLLDGIENSSLNPIPQNENISSYYKRITSKDIYINFSMGANEIYNKVRAFHPWAFCYLKIKNEFLKIGYAQIVDLNRHEFFVKNKKYNLPDRYLGEKAGKILLKGDSWLLFSTIDKEKAILLEDVKLYGFCKGILTKKFISLLK